MREGISRHGWTLMLARPPAGGGGGPTRTKLPVQVTGRPALRAVPARLRSARTAVDSCSGEERLCLVPKIFAKHAL